MSAIRGRGGELYWYDTGTSLYVKIGEVVTTSGGGPDAETIDVTTLATPVGFRGFIPGVKDAPEVTIGLHFDGMFGADLHNHAALREAVEGDDLQRFRMLFSDETFVQFDAVCTGFTIGEQNVTDKVDATFTAKPTGKPLWGDLDAMVVEGPAGSPEVLGLYLRDGDFGGMPKYAIPSADPVFTIFGEFAIWRIDVFAGGWPVGMDFYIGPENVATPDLVSEWAVEAGGTAPAPTVRRATINDIP